MQGPTKVHDYHLVSGYYDALAAVWSFDQISYSREFAIRRIKSHARVLILGPGTCRGFEDLWSGSCHVTLVDSSPDMLSHSAEIFRQLPPEKLSIQQIDVHSYYPKNSFQSIWLPYFLNVFSPEEVIQILKALRPSLEKDGEIYISDFMEPDHRWYIRIIQELWHGLPMAFFHLVTGNSWHPIHPLPDLIRRAGYEITEVYPAKFGPNSHRWIGTYVCKAAVKSS